MATSELEPLFDLLKTPELPELGPGPRVGVQSKTELDAKLQSIFKNSRVAPNRQELIRALILLWHDHQDAAHHIVQDIENPDGAFIHGIVHRREPDYSNAKYWFRRVGKHPAFPAMSERAGQALQKTNSSLVAQLLSAGRWDPMGFIDACERASQNSTADSDVTLLRQIQKIETESLLEYLSS